MRALVSIVLVLVLSGCRRTSAPTSDASPVDAAAAGAPAPAPVKAVRPRTLGTNVTFVVASDTHFGVGGIEEVNATIIRRIDELPGRKWPSAIGGTVAPIEGVVITGDLTEWGRAEEWERFLHFYGGRGTAARLTLPVFEMIGNHDKVHGPFVESQVAARHGGRFYTWDWGGLHCIALGEAPDDQGLVFLAKDLDAMARNVPLMIFFHLSLVGPWSTGNWFGDGDYKARLAKVLAGRNVAAIVHGHQHVHGRYEWEGFDVIKPGAAKHRDHSFMVIRATDDKLDVAWLDFDRSDWIGDFSKPIAP